MTRRFSLLWLLLIGVAIASAALSVHRLRDMPELPVTIGPDMRIRSVKTDQTPLSPVLTLKRNDQLVALNGRSTQDLRELRHTLLHIEKSALDAGESRGSGGAEEVPGLPAVEPLVGPVVNYQLVRPLHRFDLLLQGEPLDPTTLPPGVHEGDKLVELDGRQMKPRVGTEGLRSIISSRPRSLLVMERRNAVFDGDVMLGLPKPPVGVMVCFGLALIFSLLLWRFQHASISRWTALATAAQTIAFAWWSLLVFQYQWIIADYTLAYCAIGALVMTRPLGIFARTASAEDGGPNKWGSLALGGVGALFVIGALATNKLPNVEVALQFAAVLVGLFVIFEIVLTGLNEGSGTLLGERSVYLAGILLFVLFACVASYSIEPLAFREERWRWFAALVLALVWFGDILLCLRGLPATPFAEISTRESRREKIASFLEEIATIYPQVRPVLALMHEQRVFLFEHSLKGELELSMAKAPLRDAIEILVQERARVPASNGAPEHDDPMAGIARTMGIGLALQLFPPHFGLQVPNTHVVLLGYQREESPPVPVEDLDFAQHRMTTAAWGASLLELMLESFEHLPAAEAASSLQEQSAPEASLDEEQARHKLEEATSELEELRETSQLLRRDRHELTARVASLARWHHPAPALPANFEELLEPSLLDAIASLFTSPAPIVLSGPRGAGKTFTASVGHLMEARAPQPCVLYDAATFSEDDHELNLLSEGVAEDQEPVVFDACQGGSLIIQRAEWLPPELLAPLSQRAEQEDVRLYLCFDTLDAQGDDPLALAGELAQEVLSEREVVLPEFAQREEILDAVFTHMLEEASWLAQREPVTISPAARRALHGYQWPGNLDEVEATMMMSAQRCKGDFLELGDLPLEVRRGTF